MCVIIAPIAAYIISLGASAAVASDPGIVVNFAGTRPVRDPRRPIYIGGAEFAPVVAPCAERTWSRPLPPGVHLLADITAETRFAMCETEGVCLTPELPPRSRAMIDIDRCEPVHGALVAFQIRGTRKLICKQYLEHEGNRLLVSNGAAILYDPDRHVIRGTVVLLLVLEAIPMLPSSRDEPIIDELRHQFLRRGLSIDAADYQVAFRLPPLIEITPERELAIRHAGAVHEANPPSLPWL